MVADQTVSLQNRFDTLIRFFMYVMIFWLPYGAAVVETCIILAFVVWFIKRTTLLCIQDHSGRVWFKRLESTFIAYQPKNSSLNVWIALFFIACCFSALGSVFLEKSLYSLVTKTSEWFIVFFLMLEVFYEKKYIKIALIVLLFTAFSTVLDGFYQFYVSRQDIFMHRTLALGEGAKASFKSSNSFAGYLLIPLFVVFSLLLRQGLKKSTFVLCAFIFLVFFWALCISFSRGAYLAAFIGMIYFLFSRAMIVKKNSTGRHLYWPLSV